MKKLLPLFLLLAIAALAWHFWPEKEAVEAAGAGTEGPIQTTLGDSSPNSGGVLGTPGAEAGRKTGSARPAEPVVASPPPDTAALKALDRWHRSPLRSWSPAAGEEQVGGAIQAFSSIWDGAGGAYAASLRIETPSVFGPEFRAFSSAFATGGLAGLDRALSSSSGRGPAWLAWTEALVYEGLRVQEDTLAGPALGRLLEGMVADDYDRDRILELQSYATTLRSRARSWIPSEDYHVVSGDSLDAIGKKYRKKGHKLRFGWLMEFNRKRSDRIRIDETLKIPLAPLHLLALRSKCLLALYAGETPIHLYEASYGKEGHETPLGAFTLSIFETEPVDWGLNPPVPYGHPDHRLGTRWMGFEEDKSYGIHGNNCQDQVGAFESAGCVRMKNGEVEELFDLMPIGSAVEIRS